MKGYSLAFLFNILLISQSAGQILGTSWQSPMITTAVPLLSVNRSSISGGLGEIGVVSSKYYPEVGLGNNPALLSRNSINHSIHTTYMPWLRSLVPDINNLNISGCYSIDSLNTIGLTIDYFDFGNSIYENFFDFRYARTISEDVSAGIGIKYFESHIEGIVSIARPIRSVAVDLGIDFHHDFKLGPNSIVRWDNGFSINNMGPKVSYFPTGIWGNDFIPTMIHLGSMFTFSNNGYHNVKDIEFELDIAYQASKLFVPFPPTVLDPEDIIHQAGLEFRLVSEDIKVAFRTGVFLEHELRGARKYQTLGLGFRWREYALNTSYIRPFEERHPLEHTYRVSFDYLF